MAKIGVIGLGSIGKRHVTNLLEMGGHEILGCDSSVGQEGWTVGLPIQAVSDPLIVWDYKPDVVLICTPPASHAPLTLQAMEVNAHVFIEKPLACHGWETTGMLVKAKAKHLHLAVAYQLRWQLDGARAAAGLNITWECSQDMSLWPSQYNKDILEEFSHEIDAAVFVNGPVEAVTAKASEYGWVILLRHINCHSEIYLNPRAVESSRGAYVGTEEIWDFSKCLNDQAYKLELQSFLAVCQGQLWDERLCSGAEAAHVVKIIEACRTSASECKVVQLA